MKDGLCKMQDEVVNEIRSPALAPVAVTPLASHEVGSSGQPSAQTPATPISLPLFLCPPHSSQPSIGLTQATRNMFRVCNGSTVKNTNIRGPCNHVTAPAGGQIIQWHLAVSLRIIPYSNHFVFPCPTRLRAWPRAFLIGLTSRFQTPVCQNYRRSYVIDFQQPSRCVKVRQASQKSTTSSLDVNLNPESRLPSFHSYFRNNALIKTLPHLDLTNPNLD
jgi:hypothetical protein